MREMASGRTLFGRGRAAFGECVLENSDGGLDALLDYSVDGRAFKLYAAEAVPATYPTGWTLLITTSMKSMSADDRRIVLSLRSPWERLEKLVCPTFAGTGNLEGDAGLTGTPKPVAFGRCFNAPLTRILDASNVYMVSARANAYALYVRDKAENITHGGTATYNDQSSLANLISASVGAGTYQSRASDSVIKINDTIDGVVTADIVCYDQVPFTDASDYSARKGDIIETVALTAGLSSGEISSADKTTLNSSGDTTKTWGYWCQDLTTTYADVLSRLATGLGLWVNFDRTGVLRFQLLAAPVAFGSAAYYFDPLNAIRLRRVLPDNSGRGVPIYKATTRCLRNWRPMGQNDLGSGIPESKRQDYEQVFLRAQTASNSVATQYLTAGEIVIDAYSSAVTSSTSGAISTLTYGVAPSDLLTFFGAGKRWFELTVPFTIDQMTTIDLHSTIGVTWPRFGLSSGAAFRVVGIRTDLGETPTITYTLWG
jgi:hypothetical protein